LKNNAGWIERLRKKWKLESVKQVFIVLLVFACTGTTVVIIKKPLTAWLYPGSETSYIFTIIYLILILPVYNVLLLFYGFIFGKFRFFWEYEKKFFSKIFRIKD